MKKLNYLLPTLVGVLMFANFIWMMLLEQRSLAIFSFFVAFSCIGIALIEKEKLNK